MSIRAWVQDDFAIRGINIALTWNEVSGIFTYNWERTRVHVNENELLPVESLLRFRDDEGRALYEALARHYGNHPDNSTDLRKDYLDERKRVDKLIDASIRRFI